MRFALLMLVFALPQAWCSAAEPIHPAHSNSLTLTARALGCSVRTVEEVKALRLNCSLSWVLMRLCAVSDERPSKILAERETRTWGELCLVHGRTWAEMVQDVRRRQKDFGLVIEPEGVEQELRSASNHPDAVRVFAGRP